MKNKTILRKTALALLCSFGLSSALEIRPSADIYFPADVKIKRTENGNDAEASQKSDLMWRGNVEVLTWVDFLRFGLGVGYNSKQQSDGKTYVPAGAPIWISAAVAPLNGKYQFSPYAALRAGYIIPVKADEHWWTTPSHLTLGAGIGCLFPYNIGAELIFGYTSMLKSYKDMGIDYRVTSSRFGLQVSYGFDLSGSKKSKKEEEKSNDFKIDEITNTQQSEPAEQSSEDSYSSYGAYPYGDESTDSAPAADSQSDYSTDYSTDNSTDSSLEDTTQEPEALAEPEVAPEPEVKEEPVAKPEPEAKPAPAAKKTSKKAASKKSTRKKSVKKTPNKKKKTKK